MAKVTTTHKDVTFVLELSEVEAQYVEAALRRVMPTSGMGGGDPVWDALIDAMEDAGVERDPEAARPTG